MATTTLKLSNSIPARTAVPSPRRAETLRRTIAHRWDLVAVLFLIGSSAAYAAWTLSHLA